MSSTPVPQTVGTEAHNQGAARWLRWLQDSKVLAWPAAGAFLAAICYFVGDVAQHGEIAALGVSLLDRPAASQGYVINGAWILAMLARDIGLVVIVAAGIRATGRKTIRRLPDRLQTRIGALPKHAAWGWGVILAVFVLLVLTLSLVIDLINSADAMILKPSKDIGPAWLRMSLDQDLFWFGSYHLLLAAAATTLVFLSWWALTRFFSSPVARAVYGAWVVLQLLVLVVGFAFIMGVGSTFRPYPVVAFSNMEQLCGKHAVPVLIGSDDKLYAFLLILNVGAQSDASDPGKTILYLPRTEVKWLTVLRQEPLHLVARYHELHSLVPDTPTNPEPAPDTSDVGTPAGKAPSAAPAKPAPPN